MLAFCVPRAKSIGKGVNKMLALFIFLAVLILLHSFAIGAYLSISKIKFQSVAGKAVGTIAIGVTCSLIITFIAAVIIMPPIS